MVSLKQQQSCSARGVGSETSLGTGSVTAVNGQRRARYSVFSFNHLSIVHLGLSLTVLLNANPFPRRDRPLLIDVLDTHPSFPHGFLEFDDLTPSFSFPIFAVSIRFGRRRC